MRICLVSRYFDPRSGGLGRFSMEIYRGLKNKGFEIIPISTNRSGRVGYFMYSAAEMPFRLPRGCDVYHALSPFEAIYVPKERGIVTFHDLIPWLHLSKVDFASQRSAVSRQFISIIYKHYFRIASKIAARCSAITCNSQQTKQELITHLNINESKVRVVRLGISQELRPRAKNDNVFRIGTVSYLDPRKRIDLLIRAFLDTHVDGELVIAGKGPDYARLRALAGDDERIKFLGFVPDEKLADFYNSLDLFIFPTKFEGYGLPIIEAFACKKPVVVLEDAMIPEEIKSRCTRVDNLGQFLKNPRHNCDIEANYQFARLHDWDICIEQHIRLYKELLR